MPVGKIQVGQAPQTEEWEINPQHILAIENRNHRAPPLDVLAPALLLAINEDAMVRKSDAAHRSAESVDALLRIAIIVALALSILLAALCDLAWVGVERIAVPWSRSSRRAAARA